MNGSKSRTVTRHHASVMADFPLSSFNHVQGCSNTAVCNLIPPLLSSHGYVLMVFWRFIACQSWTSVVMHSNLIYSSLARSWKEHPASGTPLLRLLIEGMPSYQGRKFVSILGRTRYKKPVCRTYAYGTTAVRLLRLLL